MKLQTTQKLVWLPVTILGLCIIAMAALFLSAGAGSNPLGLILVIVAFICLIWIGFQLHRYIARQRRYMVGETEQQQAIIRLLDEMSTLAEGDLTIRATVSEDMTGAIADAVNYAVDALRELVIKIDDTSGRLTRFAKTADERVDQLSNASSRQATEIGVATEAITTMSQSIQKVSRNAATSTGVAKKSLEISRTGAQTVRSTIADMLAVREQMQATSKRMKRLGESSQEVGDIVRLMNDIADQTNILALNASIQSSSAGHAGKGFERVADEVQQLAQRAGEATRKIDVLVHAIQADTQEAIASMEQTTAKVVDGSRNAKSAGTALDEIEEVSSNLARLIANISDASTKQADMASKVSVTMDAIQDVTLQTVQYGRETNQLVSNLNETSSELRRSIADFTLSAASRGAL